VVFNDKMWILGGQGTTNKNDVWFSEDGVTWTEAVSNAPWSDRVYHSAVVFDDKIWVMGGAGVGVYMNDVWYSSDGVNWTNATLSAPWSTRCNAAVVVYNGKLWLLGGYFWDGTKTNYLNDVWSSEDGVNWTLENEHAGWAGRDCYAVTFNDRIYVLGGQSAGLALVNDVWYMEESATPIKAEMKAGLSEQVSIKNVVRNNSDGSIRISYALKSGSQTDISIFNLQGKSIAKVNQGFKNAGSHEAVWKINGGISESVLIVRINTDKGSSTRQIILN